MRAWVADRDTSLCVHTSSILSRPNGIQFEEMDGAQSGAKGENTVTRYIILKGVARPLHITLAWLSLVGIKQ